MSIISKQQMQALSANPGTKTLIDVRDKNEIDQGVIPKSKWLTLKEIPEAMNLGDEEFMEKYKFKKPVVGDSLVVYCRSGRRSGFAVEEFKKMGFRNIEDYSGGWLDWTADNKP
jgi:rhodanese-related sulfurtransferase